MIYAKERIVFNVKNKTHIEMYKKFLKSYSWGTTGCPFELEFPYTTIPDMIKDKLIHMFLKVEKHNA